MSTSVKVPADPCACTYIKGNISAFHASELSFRYAFTVALRLIALLPQTLRQLDLVVYSEAVVAERRVATELSELLWEELARL